MTWPPVRVWLWFAAGILATLLAQAVVDRWPAGDDEEEEEGVLGESDFSGHAESETGLGPLFNATSCATCHYLPTVGGTGPQVTLRIGFATPGRPGRPVPSQQSTLAAASIDAACRPRLGDDVTVVARRIPSPTFGAGLVDAIPDAAIERLADPDDRDGDGVRGRVARVLDRATGGMRVGRFGWKAQDPTLLSAVARAYAREMGVTNRLFPDETSAGVTTLSECDRVADPEDYADDTGLEAIDRLTSFLRQLPPIAPLASEPEPGGARLFADAGCAACHRPAIEWDAGAVAAYSDFLLHDIGTDEGLAEEGTAPGELRTAPLWGVRTRGFLLHDGRALTLDAAIRSHGGEAAGARARYLALPDDVRRELVAFLRGL
jgi:CxxC motif-containing protein (DUF1111 family)